MNCECGFPFNAHFEVKATLVGLEPGKTWSDPQQERIIEICPTMLYRAKPMQLAT